MTQGTTDNRARSLDRRWIAALAILGPGVVAFTAAVVIRERFDPHDDRLQPEYTISIVLTLVGMVLPLLSAIPVRHLGWWLIPYVFAAYAGGFVACIALAIFAVLVSSAW